MPTNNNQQNIKFMDNILSPLTEISDGLKSIGKGLSDIAEAVNNIKPTLDKIVDNGMDVKIGRKNKLFGRK